MSGQGLSAEERPFFTADEAAALHEAGGDLATVAAVAMRAVERITAAVERTFTVAEVIGIADELGDGWDIPHRDFIDRIQQEAALDSPGDTQGGGE